MDVGTLSRRVRRENPDITSPPTERRARQILSHSHTQVPRTARAEVTSFVRETRAKVDDLKGRPSHTCHCAVTRARSKTCLGLIPLAPCGVLLPPSNLSFSALHSLWKLLRAKVPITLDAPSIPFPTWCAFGFSVALSLSHRSGGRGCLCRAERPSITH